MPITPIIRANSKGRAFDAYSNISLHVDKHAEAPDEASTVSKSIEDSAAKKNQFLKSNYSPRLQKVAASSNEGSKSDISAK